MNADSTYHCPTCNKPFDRNDGLFAFAFSAHEKQHALSQSRPENLIRFEEDGLMWVCKICGDPLHIGEFSARQKVITHCREKHGSLPASSAPVTAGGGRAGKSGSGSRSFGEAVEDIAEAVIDGVGSVIGKLLGD